MQLSILDTTYNWKSVKAFQEVIMPNPSLSSQSHSWIPDEDAFIFPSLMVLKFECISITKGLITTQIAGPRLTVSNSVGMRLAFLTSFQDDDVIYQGTTLRTISPPKVRQRLKENTFLVVTDFSSILTGYII